MPSLTIVVAAESLDDRFARYFEGLGTPPVSGDVEVIAAAAHAPEGAQETLARRWPAVQWIVEARAPLVPQLWGLGVAQATGDIVALTIPACVAGPEWIARVVEAHRSPHAGIGGAIDLAPGAGLTTAAIFFVRYTSYMQPFSEGPVTDVPGDNGSYKRAAIAAHLPSIEARGFWETEINARLRETGKTLWMDPGLGVTFEGGYSVAGFSRQRYRHGLVFGREKAARLGAEPRALHVLAAPLVPPLMLARIVSTLLRKRRHLGRFAVALPLVSWFLVCWAAGEAAGLASSPARG